MSATIETLGPVLKEAYPSSPRKTAAKNLLKKKKKKKKKSVYSQLPSD